jgi:hypothetical protein
MSITRRNAQVLRYFQGIAPIGQWFTHDHQTSCNALNMSRPQLTLIIRTLAEQGYMARSNRTGQHFNYKVLKPAPEFEPQKKAAARKPRKPQLIRYAGWEQHAGDAW